MNRLLAITLAGALSLSLTSQSNATSPMPSLREEIGQMLMIGFDGKVLEKNSAVAKAIKEEAIGGVILFDYNQPKDNFDKNIESPAQVKTLNHALQTLNRQTQRAKHQKPLPLLIAVDYEGGLVSRLEPKYGFPETLPAADINTLDMAKTQAETMTSTLQRAEFNVDLAPMLDVNVNPDSNPIVGKYKRSFSSDPFTVAYLAAAFSRSFVEGKIECAYKHFPGHGSARADSHLGFVDVTDTWQPYELIPYSQLLNSSDACGIIMTAHVVNRRLDSTGLPATLSHEMITHLLRETLHYNGVVISDDMQMKAISANYGLEKALELAINAGVDMFIFANQQPKTPQDPKAIIDIIESKVNSGAIKRERIDEAYQRIVKLKARIISNP